jgi:hypothetical protein
LKFALAQYEDQSIKRSRFSEEQIIGTLKEHEAGVALRYAEGSAPARVAPTARQGTSNGKGELRTG